MPDRNLPVSRGALAGSAIPTVTLCARCDDGRRMADARKSLRAMTERFHITRDDKTTIRCPQCHQTKSVDVAAYRHIEKTVKVRCRCTCGHQFEGVLDKRRQFRKETNLPGSFRTLQSRCSASGLLTVRNISRTGIKLLLNANPGLSIGDSMRIKFSLDDAARSLVEKDVLVRKIDGLEVGTEFSQPLHNSSPGDRALGFYLLS